MKQYIPLITGIIAAALGVGYYTYHNSLVIVMPRMRQNRAVVATTKQVILYQYRDEKWHTETTSLTWPSNAQEQLTALVQAWLMHSQEQNKQNTPITIQTALITPYQELVISFERNPFAHMHGTREKWYWLEGLSKTVHEAAPTIQSIYLTANHEMIDDATIITQSPWPIHGFLNSGETNS